MLALMAAARRVRMTLTAKAKDDARVGTAIAAAAAAIMAAGNAEQAAHPVLAMADAAKAEIEAAKSALVKADAAKAKREAAKSTLVAAKSRQRCAIIASEKAKANAQARAQARAANPTPIRGKAKTVLARAEAKAKAKIQAGAKARAESRARAAREADHLRLDKLEARCISYDAELDRLKDGAVLAARCAEQVEHREMVLRHARSKEVREVGGHADSARVMCDRVGGQQAAEREERMLRKERLEKAFGLDKARADRAELSLKMVRDCLETEKETVKRLSAKKDALEKASFLKEVRLLADAALRDAAAIGRGASDTAPGAGASTTIACTTISAASTSSEEGLWLESPARNLSPADLAVSDDGTGEADHEEENGGGGGEGSRGGSNVAGVGSDVAVGSDVSVRSVVTVGGVGGVGGVGSDGAVGAVSGIPLPPATTAREQTFERQLSEEEIRRRFLEGRRLQYEGGGVQEFVPAVSLAVQCSLSPTSNALERGPLLSSGKFGVVTVVRHALGRFALKEVSPSAVNIKGGRDAARHEMRVLLSLTSHPHVVTLKGLDDTIPTMPILLELAVCDAFEILEKGHCHSWLQKTSVLRDAALGLNHIHGEGWVHVDFKAENLLMVKGNGPLLQGKVSDFGLSRLEGDVRPKMTGTPGYIPMENLTEAVATTRDQDVFSLAVFMVMMFVRPHLQGNNVFALEVLLTDIELEEYDMMDENDLDADIAFDSKVMQRTSVDGSFEEILVPSSLQGGVPLPEEVCEWLKACLSSDISARLSMTDLASKLNRLVQQSTHRR